MQNRYTERNAGSNSRTFGEQRDITKEVYAGIGLRHSWKVKQYDIKLTGVLEHGYELANDNTQQTMYTVNGPKQGFKLVQAGKGRHTNYVTAYTSVLNNNSKLKCVAGYKGSFQKYRTDHTFTLKAELRF